VGPASHRVDDILGTGFVVAEHCAPERRDGAGRGRVDSYLDMLHAARVRLGAQVVRGAGDLPGQRYVALAELLPRPGEQPDGDPLGAQVNVGVVIGGGGQRADPPGQRHPGSE
jgi:hypothetical protein